MERRPARVRGRDSGTGELVDVVAEAGVVVEVRPATGEPAVGGPDLYLAPGLIDVQVNGFAGHDLSSPTVTPDDVSAVARALWSAGVTRFCPTVTTGSRERMIASLRAIAAAAEGDRITRHAVVGVHLEGPYISPEDGPRGAHPREHVRPPSWEELQAFQDAARGLIRLVTLAPEMPGALRAIELASESGLVVALGHHAASGEQIRAAVRAGARLSTHLGNGAHALLPRHPNYIWDQLAEDALWASIIVDGHHLPPAVVKCFVRAKGVGRLLLVSDAVHVAGLPPGRYEFGDQAIELGASGRVSLAGTPYLAGSSLSLCQALGAVVRFAEVSLAAAVRMATANPAALLGLGDEYGDLRPGQPADLCLFRIDEGAGRVELMATLVAGQLTFSAAERQG